MIINIVTTIITITVTCASNVSIILTAVIVGILLVVFILMMSGFQVNGVG